MNGYADAFLELASTRAKIKATSLPEATWSFYTSKTRVA